MGVFFLDMFFYRGFLVVLYTKSLWKYKKTKEFSKESKNAWKITKLQGKLFFSISCSNQTTRVFSVVHIWVWFSERTLSNCIIFTFLKILEIHRARNFRRNVVEFWRYLIHHRVQQSIRFSQKNCIFKIRCLVWTIFVWISARWFL